MSKWVMKRVGKETGDLGKGALRDAEVLVVSETT